MKQLSVFEPSNAEQPRRPFRMLLIHDAKYNLDQQIGDLQNCGLPACSEVLLLTVNDPLNAPHWLTKNEANSGNNSVNGEHGAASHDCNLAQQQARIQLQTAFPMWRICARVGGRAQGFIIEEAQRWQPDLIYLWALNRIAAKSRALRGIIRKAVTQASFSLRVGRPEAQIWPLKRPVVVAFNGPSSAAAMIDALRHRRITHGSEITLLFYSEPLSQHDACCGDGYAQANRDWIAGQLLRTRTAMEALGYRVGALVPVGNRAQAILDEASRVDAECIIVGREPRGVLADLVAQSVAAAVAASAACPVEIVCSREQESTTRWCPAAAA